MENHVTIWGYDYRIQTEYIISDLARLWRPRDRFAPTVSPNRYGELRVSLSLGSTRSHRVFGQSLAKLVLYGFEVNGDQEEILEYIHMDGDRNNCRLSNLEVIRTKPRKYRNYGTIFEG